MKYWVIVFFSISVASDALWYISMEEMTPMARLMSFIFTMLTFVAVLFYASERS